MENFPAWTWIWCITFLQGLSLTTFPRKFSIFPITKDLLQRVFSLCACIQMRLFCSALSILATHHTGSSALRGSSSNIMSHSKLCRSTGEEIAAVTAVTELWAPAGLWAWLWACPPHTGTGTIWEQPLHTPDFSSHPGTGDSITWHSS